MSSRPNECDASSRLRDPYNKKYQGVRTRFRTSVNKILKTKRKYRTDFTRSDPVRLLVRGDLSLEDTGISTFEGFEVLYLKPSKKE